MHQRILSISECLHLYVFVSPHKNDKVWLVSHRLSLGRGVNRKSKPCRPVMFSGIGGDSSYIETEHVRDQGWHVIESSMSASMISITNGRRSMKSRESLCHSTSWQSDPSPLAPASQQRALRPGRQSAVPPSCPAGSAFTGRRGSPGSTVHC